MNVNFEPIMRGLKSGVFKCKICYMYAGFNCERRSGVKNVWKFVLLRGGGARSLKSGLVLPTQIFGLFGPPKKRVNFDKFNQRQKCVFCVLTALYVSK